MRISDWSSDVCSSDLLDIEGELSADQILQLKRKGPRIAIIIGIETMLPDKSASLSEMINSGGRAMPVILWIEASEETNGDERSEEHTSELQSIMRNTYAVFCLKKKKKKNKHRLQSHKYKTK